MVQEHLGIICGLYSCKPDDIGRSISISLLGGETNTNYLVNDGHSKRVVRVPSTGIVDRDVESRNIGLLLQDKSLVPITPKIYVYANNGRNIAADSDDLPVGVPSGTMVTEFIEGSDLSTGILADEEVQRQLVRTLHTFHTSGIRFVNDYNPFDDEIGRYREQVKGSSILPRDTAFVDDLARRLEDRLNNVQPVSTHNDLVYGNLRVEAGGRVRVLDFEYAGFNVKGGLHYDFGTLFGENLFGEKPIDNPIFEGVLEKASAAYGTEFRPEKAYVGAAVNIIVTFWWGMVKLMQAASESERAYYQRYVDERRQKISEISDLVKV